MSWLVATTKKRTFAVISLFFFLTFMLYQLEVNSNDA